PAAIKLNPFIVSVSARYPTLGVANDGFTTRLPRAARFPIYEAKARTALHKLRTVLPCDTLPTRRQAIRPEARALPGSPNGRSRQIEMWACRRAGEICARPCLERRKRRAHASGGALADWLRYRL